jgi:hypothetical protein
MEIHFHISVLHEPYRNPLTLTLSLERGLIAHSPRAQSSYDPGLRWLSTNTMEVRYYSCNQRLADQWYGKVHPYGYIERL